jgi:hypothetical protein
MATEHRKQSVDNIPTEEKQLLQSFTMQSALKSNTNQHVQTKLYTRVSQSFGG